MAELHTGTFWSDAEQAPLVVLTDFDFTITEVDVGDLVTERLAPPSPVTLERYRRKEIGTRGYWLDSMIRVDQAEGERLADTVRIDPAFPAFARWCRAEGIPLAVVSDGFWFYINRILQREGLGHLPVFCNEMAGPGRLTWPHGNTVCDMCGCCKPQVSRRLQQNGTKVVYVGDGRSDLYAVGFADWVFAKGWLAQHMAEQGSPYFPLGSFADVQRTLAADLPAFRAGTAPGRCTVQPDPLCRFER